MRKFGNTIANNLLYIVLMPYTTVIALSQKSEPLQQKLSGYIEKDPVFFVSPKLW